MFTNRSAISIHRIEWGSSLNKVLSISFSCKPLDHIFLTFSLPLLSMQVELYWVQEWFLLQKKYNFLYGHIFKNLTLCWTCIAKDIAVLISFDGIKHMWGRRKQKRILGIPQDKHRTAIAYNPVVVWNSWPMPECNIYLQKGTHCSS